jgi:glycosyltransferase involved in cell wall biosynthesis
VFLGRGFDVIHAHNPPDAFVFVAAFYKLFGKCFVFDHHDLSPEMYCARFPGGGSQLVYRALVWLEKLSCRLADHVIATNESYKQVEMQRGGVSEERITVVRNWTDLHLRPPAKPAHTLRVMNKTIIGYVGVMGYQDGVDYLLRALHHLVHDLNRKDFYCVIIGTGAAWPGLRALAQQLALDEFVWFTGLISDDDVLRYLSAADICVDPDPSNPFNDRSTMIKMMEYMALGKPIVAFDLPEHRFTAGQAAVYAAANDELAFACALAYLMDHPDQRADRGDFGRRRIETQLAGPFVIPKLLEAYATVLPKPAGAPGNAREAKKQVFSAPQTMAAAKATVCDRHDSA